MQPKPLHSACY